MSDHQGQTSNYASDASEADVQCLVCTRHFTLDAEVTDSFEALAICRECKTTVFNDNERDGVTSTYRLTRRRRRRSRTVSLESIEDTFSHEFSQLISLARQGHEADVDSPAIGRQQASYDSTPNQSQRWHASDDESDSLNYVDSMFGELESNISFGDNGGDSDTSLDQPSMMGREILIQLGNDSYMNTDTDIDPMNAGIDLWDSDDQEDVHLQESDFDEAVDNMQQNQQQSHDAGPSGLSEQESEDGVWTWRVTVSQSANMTNLMADMEGPEIRTPFVGNPGDYVDARQFEMLLEQFAEDNNSRRGAPPAAKSFIKNLPFVVISTSHQTDGDVICPVCKDPIPIKARAKELTCMHLYHSSCILPWLNFRNTCPVCRYEFPTDDPEYERSKRATTNEREIQVVEHTQLQESVGISDESDVEGTIDMTNSTVEETNTSERGVRVPEQPDRARGHRGWLSIAAVPVVSLVSLALIFCFTNYDNTGRRQLCRRSRSATTTHVDTKRSWWSMF